MEEQIISFETAKLAKEKGFKIYVNTYHIVRNDQYLGQKTWGHRENFNSVDNKISAPTQSLLQKWLRDKHKIHITIDYLELSEKWAAQACYYLEDTTFPRTDGKIGDSYEDALEQALHEALKLLNRDN